MVHNGIEYGDMELIAEAYDLLKNVGGLNNAQLQDVFGEWNQGELQSFLIEISQKVINFPDPENPKQPLVEQILDIVGMKGTGTWTIKSALDLQVPVPTMAAAVDMREISMLKDQRVAASKVLTGAAPKKFAGDLKAFINDVRDALYCSKICSYAQGMALLSAANKAFNYGIRLDEMARIWEAGCIIRAIFLKEIKKRVPRGAGPGESTDGQSLPRCDPTAPGRLAADCEARRGKRHLDFGVQRVVGLLRCLSARSLAGEFDPGPAGFLWGSYVCAVGQSD